jgi:hypothetical protein
MTRVLLWEDFMLTKPSLHDLGITEDGKSRTTDQAIMQLFMHHSIYNHLFDNSKSHAFLLRAAKNPCA